MAIQEDLNTAVGDARQALDQRIQSPALRMLVTTAVVAAACWAGAGLLCVVVGTLAVLLSIAAISLFTLGGFLFVGACVAGAWAFALSWAAAWAYIAGTIFQGMTGLVSRSYRNIIQPRITSNTSSKRGMAVTASQRPKTGDTTASNDSNNMSSDRTAKSATTESDDTPTPIRTPGAQGAQRRSDGQQLPHSTDATDNFPLTTGQDKLREPTAAQKMQPFATNGTEGDAPATFKEAVLQKEPWEGVASAGGNNYNSSAAIDSAQFVGGHRAGAPAVAGGPQLFSTALRSAMVQ